MIVEFKDEFNDWTRINDMLFNEKDVIYMKSSEVRVFDDNEREFIEILRNLNICREVACTLAYLSTVSEATSKDLELGSQLRQPEVSIAMRELRKSGWL